MKARIALMLLILLLALQAYVKATPPMDYEGLANSIDVNKLKEYIEKLSSFGSRVTGYSGCNDAANFIVSRLKEINVSYRIIEYEVTVPLDRSSYIEVIEPVSLRLNAYALWPNYVQTCKTPPTGIEGRLVYVGDGDLEDLDDKDIYGSIALIEFNSGKNWINLLRFGARGVIFIEPDETSYPEAIAKISSAPVYFPRLYVDRETGALLKQLAENHSVIRIHVNMDYEIVKSSIIVAEIEGERKDEIVAVIAHYDTWSVVPAIAPGADEATSPSLLLLLAEYFSKNRPLRTLWLVFVSGHWQALAGAREFMEKAIFGSEDIISGERKLLVVVGLDLSSDNNRLLLTYRGYFYDYGSVQVLSKYQKYVIPNVFDKYLKDASAQLGVDLGSIVENGLVVEGWWDDISGPFMLDIEPVTMAHGMGLALRTCGSLRHRWGTPKSDIKYVNLENIRIQALASSAIIYGFVNDPEFSVDWSMVKPSRIFYSPAGELAGFITAYGKVLEFNYTKNWYDRVPYALAVVTRSPSSTYPFMHIIVKCNETGGFVVHGLGVGSAIGGTVLWGAGGVQILQKEGIGYYTEAYLLDGNTGLIVKAPDLGQYGSKSILFWSLVDSHPYQLTTVVFSCASATIIDLYDISRISEPVLLDSRFLNTPWVNMVPTIMIYDVSTLSEFIRYGFVYVPSEGIATIFTPPGSRFALILKVGPEKRTSVVLINSSQLHPDGYGYKVQRGAEIILSAINASNDIATIISTRYSNLKKNMIENIALEENIKAMEEYHSLCLASLKERKYSKAYAYALASWSLGMVYYSEVMRLVNEPAIISVFFFFLLIPSVFFIERITLQFEGLKRLFTILIIASLILVIFYFLHPSLRLVANIPIAYLGLSTLLFFGIVGIVLTKSAIEMGSMIRRKILKHHVVERERTSIIIHSVHVAMGNIRRRKFLSILLFLTIIIIVLSMVSLTSIESFVTLKRTELPVEARYNGIYMRKGMKTTKDFLSYSIIEYLRSMVGDRGAVAPRLWYYPQSVFGDQVFAYLEAKDKKTVIYAALGLSPGEFKYNELFRSSIVEGRGFDEYDYYACILADKVSEKLNVSVGDWVWWQGMKLKVVGIVASDVINSYLDLDQESIMPFNPNLMVATLKKSVPGGSDSYVPLSASEVLILPHNLVKRLGGHVSSISIYLKEEGEDIARTIAMSLDLEVYYSYNGKVSLFSRLPAYEFRGLAFILIPLLIGSGTILNSMLNVLKMREREMSIYSALGLPPSGVIFLFLGELLVFAFISTLVGYTLGLLFNHILKAFNVLPETFIVNYTSMAVLFSMIFAMAATLIPSIYPIYKAARLVTPSLARKWELPTKPRGDEWEIPLPFVFTNILEAGGALLFLYEYAELHKRETVEKFIIREVKFDPEVPSVDIVLSLAPYEAKIITKATITVIRRGDRHFLDIMLRRLSGVYDTWVLSSRNFIDAIRKQLLVWRSLKPEMRREYIDKFSSKRFK